MILLVKIMKHKNLFINILKLLLSFFIYFESGNIRKVIVLIFHIKKVTPAISIILSCVSNVILLVLLFFIYKKELIKEFKIFKNKLSDNIDIGFTYWMIGLVGMMISNILIMTIFKSGGANNEQAVQNMINIAPLLMIIDAGIIAPIIEEILFRKTFKNVIKSKLTFILIAGIFFGYLHVASATTLSQFIYIIPYSSLGISLAMMYAKTDTVFTSICMHALHNTILTLFSILI